MFCSQCATQLSPDDVYCPSCSKPVASFAVEGTPIPQVEPLDPEQVTIVRPAAVSTERSLKPYVIGALFGAAFVSVFWLLLFIGTRYANTNDQARLNAANAMNEAPQSTPTPTPEPTPTPTPTPELPIVLPKKPGFFTSKSCRYSNKGQPIMVRKDCDVRDCLNDAKTIVGVMPDGGVAIISDSRNKVPAGRTYAWWPVETEDEGVLWVASNKIACSE